jgi:hypothetical protein
MFLYFTLFKQKIKMFIKPSIEQNAKIIEAKNKIKDAQRYKQLCKDQRNKMDRVRLEIGNLLKK